MSRPSKLVPGMHLRPHYSARVRLQLERIRVAWENGRISWTTAVQMADRAKGRQS